MSSVIGGVKRPPSLNSMAFPANTSAMPGSPHASSLLNPNFFTSPVDFSCQGNKVIFQFSIESNFAIALVLNCYALRLA